MFSRTFTPHSPGGCPLSGRNMPSRFKAEKMVYAHTVEQIKHLLKTLDPPSISPLLQYIPVVERITPQLAIFAEIIRWNTCHGSWASFTIQQEEIAIAPDIGRIIGYEDRQVTDDGNAMRSGVFSQRSPLAVKLPLKIFLRTDFRPQFNGRLFISPARQEGHICRPAMPTFTLIAAFQSHEQGVVVQPVSGIAKVPEFLHARCSAGGKECCGSLMKHIQFGIGHHTKINPLLIDHSVAIFDRQIAFPHELFQVDQQRVACKG